MPTTATTPAHEPKVSTAEEQRRECAYSLACDLIERGLQSKFDDLYITLLQIMDSELIRKDDVFHDMLNKLYVEIGRAHV